MRASEASVHADDIELLRQLPRWVDITTKRLGRYMGGGWDINGLCLLRDDARRLSAVGTRHGIEAAADLEAFASSLATQLDTPTLPDSAQTRAWLTLLEGLCGRLPPMETLLPPPAAAAEPAAQTEATAPDAPAEPAAPAKGGRKRGSKTESAPALQPPAGPSPAAARATAANEQTTAETLRVYHLSDGGTLADEIDHSFAAQGWSVDTLESADALCELLGALPADIVLVGAGFIDQLEAIGAVLRATRERMESRLLLIALAAQDELGMRLAARRAGVDALLVAPTGAAEILNQIRAQLAPTSESPYRVLVVEDDQSQALFAESILRNAGMQAQVVGDPFAVMPTMEDFQPDLVLMDLHMPRCNGIELTALIRERERFLHTPIVFLSGESDQDVQFEALDAGGDDFLAKPVRPRHLIAAVQNRISRARALGRRRSRRAKRDPVSGLFARETLLDAIENSLTASPNDTSGGVLFLDLEAAPLLRDRVGLTALENLAEEAGGLIGTRLGQNGQAARFGDTSFTVLVPDRDMDGLESLALDLRDAIYAHGFQAGGRPIRLRFSVGICAFDQGFADAGALLNAAERICREARSRDRGVKRYQPPQNVDAAGEKRLLAQIRKALDEDAFELIYQPIVAVQGGEQAQYQTLLRLRGEDGRVHPAGEIIPLAERHGLMAEIDRWVLDEALSVLQRRQEQTHSVRLFVTQSAATLTLTGQVEWLREALAKYGIDGPSLVVEIRLDDAIVHTDSIQQFCRALVPDGVQFCLSQFESSLDSASLLDRLPLGLIKLAPKYLGASATQALRDELRVLIDQAHRRNLQVIGHRVEDAHSAATLWMSGIDYLQGNLVQQAGSSLDFDFHSAVL